MVLQGSKRQLVDRYAEKSFNLLKSIIEKEGLKELT